MAFVRTAYLALCETHHVIEGRLMVHTVEGMDDQVVKQEFEFNFYRPGSGIKDAEWLKDMLVQVIEQL